MEMTSETLGEGLVKLNLKGSMTATGAQKIDLGFNAVVGSAKAVVVDLGEVDFLASMGIRTLVIGAKALQRKGGRMILLNPSSEVEQVLVSSGVDSLMKVSHDLTAALAELSVVAPAG